LKTKIQSLAQSIHSRLISIRRHLHMHPELSFQEVNTGKFIKSILEENRISFSGGWAEHGVVAIIGDPNKPCFALRADMDALPILETNEVEYKSKIDGVMHACGHDVHTTSLLGAAIILKSIEPELKGCVKLIFQPGEEKLPGGASILIKEGVLKNPNPKSMIGQHVHPPLEVGKLGFRPGKYMASADEIRLKVIGKGGHAALPHNCVDTMLIAARILINLQDVVARNANPTIPTVLSFGKINSEGGATNVIPDVINIEGTFRTMDESWRREAHKRIIKIAENTASLMGGTCEVDLSVGYPCVVNEPYLTEKIKSFAIEYLGKENVVDLPIRLTSEDFGWYSQELPACFYRLGTGNTEKGINSPVHTSSFDIDEKALIVGAGFMAFSAYKTLEHMS